MNNDNRNSKINIVVLFGGESAEHDVSCVTAAHVLRALNADKYVITTVGITRDGNWVNVEPNQNINTDRLTASGTPTNIAEILQRSNQLVRTVVVPLLHGPMGEDGTVQGALELAHVAYVGAGFSVAPSPWIKVSPNKFSPQTKFLNQNLSPCVTMKI